MKSVMLAKQGEPVLRGAMGSLLLLWGLSSLFRLIVFGRPCQNAGAMNRVLLIVMLYVLLWPIAPMAQQATGGDDVTVIYFVRHAEVDPTQPTFPLSAAGRLKAGALARTVSAEARCSAGWNSGLR